MERSTNRPLLGPPPQLLQKWRDLRAEVITREYLLVDTGRRTMPVVTKFTVTVDRGSMLLTARERAQELADVTIIWSSGPSHLNVSKGKGGGRRFQLILLK